MRDIYKHFRIPDIKDITRSKADLDFCNGDAWWVTNDDEVALPTSLLTRTNLCVPDATNSSIPNGIRLMLVLPLKHMNDYALNDTIIFGKINGSPIEWVYIGKRRFVTYEVLDHYSFSSEKLNSLNYKGSAVELRARILAMKMFSRKELESIADGTFEKYLVFFLRDGVLTIKRYVNEIPDGAYVCAKQINKIIIEERKTPLSIGDYAFSGTLCESIEGLEYCTSIGIGAFSNSNLSGTIKIGNCKNISDCAFESSNITRIVFNGAVDRIGISAFLGNKISEVTFGESHILEVDEQAFSENYLSKAEIDKITDKILLRYASSAFEDQVSL